MKTNLPYSTLLHTVPILNHPYNGRERDRKATCIVEMKGNTTYLQDPEEPNEDPRKFAFDFSYWSHDGSKADKDGYYGPDSGHPNGKKFCDQVGRAVFFLGFLLNVIEVCLTVTHTYSPCSTGKK